MHVPDVVLNYSLPVNSVFLFELNLFLTSNLVWLLFVYTGQSYHLLLTRISGRPSPHGPIIKKTYSCH